MKTKIFKVASALGLGVFAATMAASIGIYRFSLDAYIHDYFGTKGTEVVNTGGDDQDTQYYKSEYKDTTELVEARLAYMKDSVSEGTVLLKNDGDALPIAKTAGITLLGRASADLAYGMDAGAGMIANANAMCKHFDQALKDAGYTNFNQTMYDYYAGVKMNQSNPAGYYGLKGDLIIGEPNPSEYSADAVESVKTHNDVGVIVLKRNVGEGFDLWTGESGEPVYQEGSGTTGSGDPIHGVSSLELTPNEKDLLQFAKDNFSKVVVILNSNQQIAISGLNTDTKINAILQVGGLGYNGIDGLVEVLSGAVAPSGRLISSWAQNSLSAPATQDLGSVAFSNAEAIENYFVANEKGYTAGSENPFRAIWYVAQKESVYVGYRYYETRYEDDVLGKGNADSAAGTFGSVGSWNYAQEMGYTFGYGLSYTTFDQEYVSAPTFNDDAKTYTFKVKVTNKGAVAGKEVVQLWASTPYTQEDITDGCEKSAIQLVNFEKTGVIQPGQSETLTVTADLHNIASWDSKANDGNGGYILSQGKHYFALGDGAHHALNNVLAQKAKDGVSVNTSKMDEAGDASKVFSFNQGKRDTETYSVSEYTGVKTTNQLAGADINRWVDDTQKVKYLTRNDWNTFPKIIDGEANGRTSSKLTATDSMLKEMIGQTSVNGIDYSNGTLKDKTNKLTNSAATSYNISMMMGRSYDDENWDRILDQMTTGEMAALVGAASSMTKEVKSVSYPGGLQSDGPIGFYSANLEYKGTSYYNGFTGPTDWKGNKYEGCIPSRSLEGTVVVAASFNKDLAARRGKLLGDESILLKRTGIWGISGTNIARTPFSGRSGEYYGEDPMMGAYIGGKVSKGFTSKGGVAYTKHFAFNDQETNRYGGSFYMTEQEAREISLRNFEGILANKKDEPSNAMGLMESFCRIGPDFVGENSGLMTQILRNEWGFEGVTITDMAVALLTYYHAPEMVKAGTDTFDTGSLDLYANVDFTDEKIAADPILHAALRQACHRTLYVFVNSNAMNGVAVNAKIVRKLAPWEVGLVWLNVGVGIIALGLTGAYVFFVIKDKKAAKNPGETKKEAK
jgi:beta-glucosidase